MFMPFAIPSTSVGVVNHLARRGRLEPGSELYGEAFESWIHHELRAFCAYRERYEELAYWRLAGGPRSTSSLAT